MADDLEQVRGKNVVAVIDFHETIIYLTDAAAGQRPERLVASDPRGRFHQVHHHAGNPSGTYEDDSPAYWQELTDALAPAGAILLLGHGNGKAGRHRSPGKETGARAGAVLLRRAIRLSLPERSRRLHPDDGRELAPSSCPGCPLQGIRDGSISEFPDQFSWRDLRVRYRELTALPIPDRPRGTRDPWSSSAP